MARKLSQIMSDIKKAKELASQNFEGADSKIAGTLQASVRAAKQNYGALSREYNLAFRNQVIIILLSGEAESKALETVQGLENIPTVDSNEFYKIVADTSDKLSPGLTKLTQSTFMTLNGFLTTLSKSANVRLGRALQYQTGDGTLTLQQNLRNTVRGQFGSAGPEPAWVLLKGMNIALEKQLETDPLPIVAYNLNGATLKDYKGLFPLVFEYNAETGTKEEFTKAMKEIKSAMKKQNNPQKNSDNT